MRLNIKGTNFTLTKDVEEYLGKKLDAISKFLPREENGALCQVELGKTTRHHQSGDIFRAEINLETGGRMFRAVAERNDLRAAIDAMRDAITKELGAYKAKRVSLLRRSGARVKQFLKGLYPARLRKNREAPRL